MTERILQAIDGLHLAAGVFALLLAPLALITVKGGDAHRRWGKGFLLAMALLALTSLTRSIWHLEALPGLLALLAGHLCASGYRSLYLKKLHEGQKPARPDVLLHGAAGVLHGGVFLWGAIHLLLGQRDKMAMVFLVFGTVGLVLVLAAFHRFYKRQHDKLEWLYGHMMGLVLGYVVLLAAFTGLYAETLPSPWLRWTWPIVPGMIGLVLWVRHYQQRFSKGRRAREVFPLRIR